MFLQMKITAGLTALNVLLLLAIVGFNARSYAKMRAEYTLFVLVFAAIFLLQNIVGAYYMLTNMEFYVEAVTTHMLVLSGLQTVAFSGLLWMQLR
jgi:hypothetical protein